jgi:general secretion pathway protein A
MYLAQWGLQEPPFRNAIDPRCFFQSPTHEEALARLQFLIDGDRRAGLLLGTAGSGKSLLLAVLAVQARRHGLAVAQFSLLSLESEEFLATLAGSWGLDPAPQLQTNALWRLLHDRLTEHHLESRGNIVLLDDAEQASTSVLAQVLRLAQTDVASCPATTLVLAARTDQVGRLGDRLLELADLRIDLLPWNADDTRCYVEHSLARAGRIGPVFTPEAIVLLAELSRGIPRNVAQLADLALIAAAGQALPAVDAHTIEAVYGELGVVNQFVDAR